MEKDAKQVPARYVMDYAGDELSGKKLLLPPLGLQLLIIKFRTIFWGLYISLEHFNLGTNSMTKNVLNNTARKQVFADKSFELTEAKRYSVVLSEGKKKRYCFVRFLLLLYL